VATGPWDPTSWGTPGSAGFLASDADREGAVDVLKAAFVRGALTRDELTLRTGRALTARTYAGLAAITAGLNPATPRPAAQRARRRVNRRVKKRVNKKVVAWSAVAVILSAALGVSFLTYYGGFLVLMLLAFVGAVLSSKPPAPPKESLAKSMGGKH
jgi:asparagine N-glycosylation enzyme membrane subunit Stt3